MGDVVRLPVLNYRRRVAGVPRPMTIQARKGPDFELESSIADLRLEAVGNPERPRTRLDCEDGERPCPWVGCRYHLAIEVNARNGSIKLNQPDLEPDELAETCALDVADGGARTLGHIAQLLNVTLERARQLEESALRAFQRSALLCLRKDDLR